MSLIVYDELEKNALTIPQVGVDTLHHFYPSIYIREMAIKAGAIILGHEHITEHLSQCVKGRLQLISEHGNIDIEAPWQGLCSKGRKCAIILEDLIWFNIHPNPEDVQSIDVLERMFLRITDTFNGAVRELPNGVAKIKSIKPLPYGIYKFRVRGDRIFSTAHITQGELIGKYTDTVLEKYTQVGDNPNAFFCDGYLYALKSISGSYGGIEGEEIIIEGD